MPAELRRKLGYRGGPAAIIGAPEGYDLSWIDAGSQEDAPLAFVQVFVTSREKLRTTAWPLLARSVPDPVFWVTYPKQSAGVPTDLNRDVIARTVGDETAYRVVSNVEVDSTWSALRLRPKALVRPRG